MAIFKAVPEDLRFFAGGAGGGGQAPAPEGLVSPTPAGTSSRNGKVIFLKNILRPIVKTMPCEPTTMCLALVLKAQLKSFELQRFRGECRRLERRAAQLPSDQPHAGRQRLRFVPRYEIGRGVISEDGSGCIKFMRLPKRLATRNRLFI